MISTVFEILEELDPVAYHSYKKTNYDVYAYYCAYSCLGRRTEEGYAIFKEDELGINAEAGGIYSHSLAGRLIH
jgi:hypothetical protein